MLLRPDCVSRPLRTHPTPHTLLFGCPSVWPACRPEGLSSPSGTRRWSQSERPLLSLGSSPVRSQHRRREPCECPCRIGVRASVAERGLRVTWTLSLHDLCEVRIVWRLRPGCGIWRLWEGSRTSVGCLAQRATQCHGSYDLSRILKGDC